MLDRDLDEAEEQY
jgi:hypothetical protein